MLSDDTRKSFTPTHHAMLFGWLSREVIRRVGAERGEAAIRKAVRRYGEQRGNRMALRAQRNGHALTMVNYIAYSEWQAGEGEMQQEMAEKTPDARVFVHRCPWHEAWAENDLMPYGRLYCLEVDEALMRGFNPALRLEVYSTRTNDGTPCEFVFHDAKLTLPNLLALAYKKAVRPGDRAVMPWDYHTGHLYKTVREVIVEELGQVGEEAASAALAAFAGRYGEDAAQVVAAHWDTDFDHLPE